MKTKDLVVAQIEALATTTKALQEFTQKNAPDGWTREELETVDGMVNTIIRQGWGVLGGIGETLKRLRSEEKNG